MAEPAHPQKPVRYGTLQGAMDKFVSGSVFVLAQTPVSRPAEPPDQVWAGEAARR